MALTWPPLATIKDKNLLAVIRDAAVKEHNVENFDFYFDRRDNKKLFETYVAEDSPRQVNLPGKMRKAMEELAKQKKWSAMASHMTQAKAVAANLVDGETIRRLKVDPKGDHKLAAALMGFSGPKLNQALPYLEVCEKPRTPGDYWQAYQLLVKMGGKSKVDAVLKAMGAPPPSKAPESDEAIAARNRELDKEVKKFKTLATEALKYYESAMKAIDKKGLPGDPVEVTRMFNSGRMRHQKVSEPWPGLLRRDKDFAVKYKEVVTLKRKVDEAWGEYRKELRK